MCNVCNDIFCNGNPCNRHNRPEYNPPYSAPFVQRIQEWPSEGTILGRNRCGCNCSRPCNCRRVPTGCLDRILTNCVFTVAAYPCLGLASGANLTQLAAAVEALCVRTSDCCTNPSTYTINSICNGDPPITASTITFTPNFTYSYPLIVTAFISRDGGAHWTVLPLILPIFGGMTAGVPVVVQPADVDPPYGSIDLSDLGDASIRIIDNQSNASAIFQIAPVIPTCT